MSRGPRVVSFFVMSKRVDSENSNQDGQDGQEQAGSPSKTARPQAEGEGGRAAKGFERVPGPGTQGRGQGRGRTRREGAARSKPLIDRGRIVAALREIGARLRLAGDNPFRARAYEGGAEAVEALADAELADHLEAGTLVEVPGIGGAPSGTRLNACNRPSRSACCAGPNPTSSPTARSTIPTPCSRSST